MKKKLTVLCLLFIFAATIKVGAVTTDKEGPVLNSISFLKTDKKYTYDDKIYLNIDAYDEVSGIKVIYLSTKNIFGVSSWESMQVFYDDDNKPYVMIPKSYYNGIYPIYEITLRDNADNDSTYLLKGAEEFIHCSFCKNIDSEIMEFELINGNEYAKPYPDDIIPPVISGYTIDKKEVSYGETVTVTIEGTDNDSGIRNFTIWVKDSNSHSGFELDMINIQDNTYTGSFKATLDSGEYELYYIDAYDKSGNSISYYSKDYSYECTNNLTNICDLEPIKLTINEAEDEEKHEISIDDVKLTKTEFNAPTYIDIEVKFSSNVLLKSEATVVFTNSNKEEIWGNIYLDENGNYKGSLDVDQYVDLDEYELTSIVVWEEEGAHHDFSKYDHKYKTDDLNYDIKININSKFIADVTTGTNATNMLDAIKNAKDDAKIYIDALNNTVIKKEVFDAIKGTNKTIYIESNGIEWIFNGSDIKNAKDIDVKLDIFYDHNYSEENIEELVEKALILKFEDNGELPGVATVRIKLDYALRNYIGDKIYVYYYNNELFSDITGNLLGQNENGWFEFKIDHNSIYVLSTTKPDKKYISKTQENLNQDNENIIITNKEENLSNDVKIYIALGSITLVIIVITIFFMIRRKQKNKVKAQ